MKQTGTNPDHPPIAARERQRRTRATDAAASAPAAASPAASGRVRTLLVASCGWPTDAVLPKRKTRTRR